MVALAREPQAGLIVSELLDINRAPQGMEIGPALCRRAKGERTGTASARLLQLAEPAYAAASMRYVPRVLQSLSG